MCERVPRCGTPSPTRRVTGRDNDCGDDARSGKRARLTLAKMAANLKCSITGELFVSPVVATDGHAYEECAIREWFQSSDRSPMTNERLKDTSLVVSLAMRSAVEDFVESGEASTEEARDWWARKGRSLLESHGRESAAGRADSVRRSPRGLCAAPSAATARRALGKAVALGDKNSLLLLAQAAVAEASELGVDGAAALEQRCFAKQVTLAARCQGADCSYMTRQPQITPWMRSVVVDWLLEVHHKLGYQEPTVYLAVAILDRFLSQQTLERSLLQLVGVTALLIATRYDNAATMTSVVAAEVTDEQYGSDQVVEMEQTILQAVPPETIAAPCADLFFERILRTVGCESRDSPTYHRAEFYLQRSLLDYEALRFAPSELAQAAACVALANCDSPEADADWPEQLEELTGRSKEDMAAVCRLVANNVAQVVFLPPRAAQQQRDLGNVNCDYVKRKFASPARSAVSTEPCPRPDAWYCL